MKEAGQHRAQTSKYVQRRKAFEEAWAFGHEVQPLFNVPSCVVIGRRRPAGSLPDSIHRYSGRLPSRDASLEQAEASLEMEQTPWPDRDDDDEEVAYEGSFRQGATLVPRVLVLVEHAQAGALGSASTAPLVESRRSPFEKPPWKGLEPLRKAVDVSFVRPAYLGESIAPYRVLWPLLAVVPWDDQSGTLLDAAAARRAGHRRLAAWMEDAEALWEEHGTSNMSLIERWDYHAELSEQFPISGVRLVYAKSGTNPAAAIIRDGHAVIDHKLYWAPFDALREALYLEAVLNSEAIREITEPLQSKGQWGARDFDKYILRSIPAFNPMDSVHTDLASAAERAEEIAEQLDIREDLYFVTARKRIREALAEDGIGGEIEGLVRRLIGG